MNQSSRPAPTILIVDDDASVRFTSRRALSLAGYTVMDAGDGETALAIAMSWRGDLDLLVTDWVMPGMNGEELAFKFQQVRPGVPVLFISGHIEEPPVQAGVLRQVFKGDGQFLQKPFSTEMLQRRVRAMLGGR